MDPDTRDTRAIIHKKTRIPKKQVNQKVSELQTLQTAADQQQSRVSRNVTSQEKLGFCDGGLSVVVEGDEAAVTFSPFIRSLRGAQGAESSAGPAQAINHPARRNYN